MITVRSSVRSRFVIVKICEMADTDLSFEKSEVEATITAPILSIKNPLSGRIVVPAVGEIIRDDEAAHGEIIVEG